MNLTGRDCMQFKSISLCKTHNDSLTLHTLLDLTLILIGPLWCSAWLWLGLPFLVEVWTISHEGWEDSNPSAIYLFQPEPGKYCQMSVSHIKEMSVLIILLKYTQLKFLGRSLQGRQQAYITTKLTSPPNLAPSLINDHVVKSHDYLY